MKYHIDAHTLPNQTGQEEFWTGMLCIAVSDLVRVSFDLREDSSSVAIMSPCCGYLVSAMGQGGELQCFSCTDELGTAFCGGEQPWTNERDYADTLATWLAPHFEPLAATLVASAMEQVIEEVRAAVLAYAQHTSIHSLRQIRESFAAYSNLLTGDLAIPSRA